MAKDLVSGPISASLAQIGAVSFFLNPALPVTRYHGQLSSCTTSEKINEPILRKVSDGRRDGETDERE